MKALLQQKNGTTIPLPSRDFFIGRSPDNDVVLPHPSISRRHCRICKRNRSLYIEDLKSINGVSLNNRRIVYSTLKNNDKILIGTVHFTVTIDSRPLWKRLIQKKIFIIPFILIVVTSITLPIFFHSYIKSSLERQKIRVILNNELKSFSNTTVPTDWRLIQKVADYIAYESRDTKGLRRLMKRAKRYWPHASKTFSSYNVPEVYVCIAFVESNFTPRLRHPRSGATGMWQVMAETGRDYGLKVTPSYDERYDPIKSAHVTARYIQDMIGIFGAESFNLIVASYNCGDGCIRYALKKINNPTRDRNFWHLYKHNLIPQETKQYIIKIFAYIVLAKRHGLLD